MPALFSSFILCTILYFTNSLYIEIPFKVQNFTYEDRKQLILKYIYKDILVSFLVGNPPQSVNLSACLGEYSTFIIANDAYGYMDATFDKSISRTYKEIGEPEQFYYQTYREAIKSTDDFKIPGTKTTINNLKFNLATEIQDGSLYCYYCEILTQPGMLGLLIAQTKANEENIYDINFISQLKNRSLISSYDFFFNFEDNDSGKIVFGARPDEYFEKGKYNKAQYAKINTELDHKDVEWCIKFDEVHYGDRKMLVKPSEPLILRIEFGLILGYNEWEYVLDDYFFSKLIENKQCIKDSNTTGHDPAYRYRYYYCKNDTDLSGFQNFTFTINQFNHSFTLTKEDLFLDEGDKYIFLMAFGGMSEFVLGLPFLKKHKLIFNQDSKTIGFYLNEGDEEEEHEGETEKEEEKENEKEKEGETEKENEKESEYEKKEGEEEKDKDKEAEKTGGSTDDSGQHASDNPKKNTDDDNTETVLIIVCSILGGLIIIGIIVFLVVRFLKNKNNVQNIPLDYESVGHMPIL